MITPAEEIREKLAYKHFGRSFILARAGKQCVKCGKVANKFKDRTSLEEYNIIGYCQACQDKYFEQDSACSFPENSR